MLYYTQNNKNMMIKYVDLFKYVTEYIRVCCVMYDYLYAC